MPGKHALKTSEDATKATADEPAPASPGLQETVGRVLKHPAAAPTAVTVVAVALVLGLGWLNRSSGVGPASDARPLAEGEAINTESIEANQAGDGSGNDERILGEAFVADAPLVPTRGRQAVAVPTWLDIPLVAPAYAVRPDAAYTLIPGAVPTTVTGETPSGGVGAGGGGSSGSTTSTTRPGTGTTRPSTGSTSSTTTPDSPTTSQPPDTTPTTETPTTQPPDTTPTTETPTTQPPDTTVPPDPGGGGLLAAVDDLVDNLTDVLEPVPLL